MKQQQMYCNGCHRDVRVLMTDPVDEDAQANVRDPELICLEVGEWCNGQLCPLGASAPGAMVTRLIHSGLSLDSLATVRAFCPDCGVETDFALYGGNMEACEVCGTARLRPTTH